MDNLVLGQREHRVECNPREEQHEDGGTSGLLTISYTTIKELPPDIGYTVLSQKWVATEDPLLALKRVQDEEAAKKRAEAERQNARLM